MRKFSANQPYDPLSTLDLSLGNFSITWKRGFQVRVWLICLLFSFSFFFPALAATKYPFAIKGSGTVKACNLKLDEIPSDGGNCPKLSLNVYTGDAKPLSTSFTGTLQQLHNNQGTGFNVPFTIVQGKAFEQVTIFYGSDETGTWQLAVLDSNGQTVSATKTITVSAPAKTSPTTTTPKTPTNPANTDTGTSQPKKPASDNGNTGTSPQNGESIVNPFKGGDNIIDLISTLANFIFNLGVPVAVIIIIYSGVRMLTSGGNSKHYQVGIDGLKYSILGLAVLLIGKGFVSLIKSFLGVITK